MIGDIAVYILVIIIGFIMGVSIVIAPDNVVLVKGSKDNYYVEYKAKVYKLVILKPDKEFINE